MTSRPSSLVGFVTYTLLSPQDPAGGALNGPGILPQNIDGQVIVIVTTTSLTGTATVKLQTAPLAAGPWTDIPGGAFPPLSGITTLVLPIDRGSFKNIRVSIEGTLEGATGVVLVGLRKYSP